MPDPYVEQIMVADGDGDHPDVEEVKYETASQAAIDFENGANSLPDSTAVIEDDDKLITRDGTNWVKKTFSKLWDYIKNKVQTTELNLSQTLILSKTQDASGTANNGPALIVGGTASQVHLELDPNEIMCKDNGTTPSALYLNNDGGVVFLGKEYYNTITGSGTAAQDKGEGVTNRYVPAKWTFNIPGGALTTGYRIQIIIPVAGHSYGVYLSIDNGTTYKPIVYQGTTRLTTHFGNGIPLELVYHSSGSVDSIFPLAGGDERTTVTGGVWRVLNAYDSGNNYVTQTATSSDANYEVLFSATADNTTRTETARKASSLKFNPSTGNLQTTKLNGYTPSTANTATTVALRDSNGNINAQKFNGYAISSSADASTLALRNSSGDLYARFFNMGYTSSNNPASYTAYPLFKDSNGWIRMSSLANFKSWLGVSTLETNLGNVGSKPSSKTASISITAGGSGKGSASNVTIYRIHPTSKIGIFYLSCSVSATFTNQTLQIGVGVTGFTVLGMVTNAMRSGDPGSYTMYSNGQDVWMHQSSSSGSGTIIVHSIGLCSFT